MTITSQRRFENLSASGIPAQMIRYGVAGGLSTCIYSAVYLQLAWWAFPGAQVVFAVPFAFLTALAAGFFLHSNFSFAGHGMRENSGRQHGKFVIVHLVGLSLNMAFTWLLTAALGAPAWAALLPTVTLTPLVTFLLQRQWVFA